MIKKKKNNFKVFSLLILLFSCHYIKAQIKITGVVINEQNTAIENANVLVYDTNSNIITYTYTKKEGMYTLNFNTNFGQYIKLSAASIGYQKRTDSIKVLPNLKQYKFNFKLIEKVEQLSEVLLQPNEKISRESNTTTYKVKAFNKGTEQTVEDVLKNLPGIEILKNGTVKAHGRLIDKLLIEGEDMFNKNYTILSKNLDAKVLSEVEILDNFEDNPVLAKVIPSNKVAINLVLKEEYKNIWFGNASTGIGTEDRIKLASNIGLIKKKIKFFYFNNYNNLGTKATDLLSFTPNTSTREAFSDKTIEPKSNVLYNTTDNNNSIFKDGESTFNKATINSLGFVTSLKSNLKIRGTTYIANDVENQLTESKTTFNTDLPPIIYSKKNSSELKNTIAGGDVELKYVNGKKSYLKNTLVYNNKPKKTNSQLLFNDNTISELLEEKEYSIYNHFNYTLLLGKKKVLHNYLYFGKNEVNQNAIINSPVLNDVFSSPENNFIQHSSKDNLSVYGLKSSTQINFKKVNTSLELGYESITENKQNKFKLLDLNNNVYIDSIQNNLNFKQKKAYIETDLKYVLSKKVEIAAGLSINHININTEFSRNNKLFLNPNLRLYLKNLKVGFISFVYRRNNNTPNSNLFLRNYQLNNYQSFKRGTTDIRFPVNNSFGFFYEKNNELHTKSINARLHYITSNGRYSSSNQIGQDLILSTSQFVNGGNVLSLNIDYISYFKKLNFSTKLGFSQNTSNTPIKANTLYFNNLKTQSTNYFLSGRTYFRLPINFDFKLNLRKNKSLFNNIESLTVWKSLNLNTTYKVSKTIIASLNNKFYLLENGNYSFNNFKIDYKPEESKFSYQLVINNLANEKVFSINNIDEFSIYKSTTRLLPRYAFALIKYRF